jgi:mycothiol synthase
VIHLRAPTLDDIPELTEFLARLEQSGGRGESEDDIRHLLTTPLFDIEADFRIALEDGQIVGWCDVWDQNKAHERLFLDPRASHVAPHVYATLFDWGIARCQSLAVNGAVCRAAGSSEDEAFAAEVTRRGFRLIRHFFRMEIDLDHPPDEAAWPNGIAVRAFRPGEERVVYDAIMDAFADHWDFVPTGFDDWEQFMVRSPTFDPTLWFLAEDGGELAGFSLCRSERRTGVGHVGVLGVRPPWRRRGLGSALLLHSFHELRRRGRSRVDLGVDGENTTGAVGLYERAGMKVVRRLDSYEKVLA